MKSFSFTFAPISSYMCACGLFFFGLKTIEGVDGSGREKFREDREG